MKNDNREWSERILKKIDPGFRHRWEVFNEALQENLSPRSVWIDLGCGNDLMVEEFSLLAALSVGVDIIRPGVSFKRFVRADLKKLPFKNETIDLITLRFVVEHFESREPYVAELERVLRKNGKVMILTTNLLSPLINIPRLFPESLKIKILSKLFKVSRRDIFPAYHKLNTPEEIKTAGKNLSLLKMQCLSDLNYKRKWLFILFLGFHLLTKIKFLERLRTNLLGILEKS
jgi:ubiquinone/menaquinone biosynthesis C-methylase UbiE